MVPNHKVSTRILLPKIYVSVIGIFRFLIGYDDFVQVPQDRRYSRDCPQRSDSGPLYWILMTNSLLELDLGLDVIAMVNFVVLVKRPNAHNVSKKATAALSRIAKWAEL